MYKNVYYADHPGKNAKHRNITLAFSESDQKVYSMLSPLSSQEIRSLLGYESYQRLKNAADYEQLALNTYCTRLLRNKLVHNIKEDGQLYLTNLFTDPIQSTFRGGDSEPLHNWYPFLEGYSPKFVKDIIESFFPEAQIIFDPFSGTGTTALTAARLGIQSYYCEINPLLQFLTDVKLKALSLKDKKKQAFIHALSDLCSSISKKINECEKDPELEGAYTSVFGDSKFFSENTYICVLKARTLVNRISCFNPLLADFLLLAILSSLVPCSLLKRAGDLRFKTEKELRKGAPEFTQEVSKHLYQMIEDLDKLSSIDKKPVLLCDDAKSLCHLPPLNIEMAITSPPYLNGTNYFRNTKVELWFLKCLLAPDDLSRFRRQSITAGINDVTSSKGNGEIHPRLEKLINMLSESAYDKRIPKMVNLYFQDMEDVFDALTKHMVKNAVLALDIGDSSYSGIHVPTDKLLNEILRSKAFKLEKEIPLRKRLSRDKTVLRQVLLIYRYNPGRKPKIKKIVNQWNKSWNIIKKDLPHQKHPYTKRNWGHPLHSLCSYQGKMKPSLAYHLVKTFVPEGGKVLDPFAGVGTIPFEGALNGIKSYGFEISPAAKIIATAKVKRTNYSECTMLIDKLEEYLLLQKPYKEDISKARLVAFNKKIEDYYEERTLREILLARRFFRNKKPTSPSESLVFACLLHILHGNRPYALSRRSHPLTPFAPTGPFEYRPLIPRLKQKVERSLRFDLPESFVEGQIYDQDATSWWPSELDNLDAIVTSPPFFDSTRFHLANWIRLWFSGWEYEDFNSKPLYFVDERQKNSFTIYEPILRQARERLKTGGVVVFHLGKSKKCDMAHEISKIAKMWFKVLDVFSESVEHCESHGIRDKGTVKAHQYLVLG